jgi:hypothetical protein
MRNLVLGIMLLVVSSCGFIAPLGLDEAMTVTSQLGSQPSIGLSNPLDPKDVQPQACKKFDLITPLEQILQMQVPTQNITGHLQEEIQENMQTGFYQSSFYLVDDFGKHHLLKIEPETLNKSRHLIGKKVNLEIKSDQNIYMLTQDEMSLDVQNIYESLEAEAHALVEEDIKLLAVLVEFNNVSTFSNFPISEASDYMNSIRDYYLGVSRGQTNIIVDVDGDGTPDIAKIKINGNSVCSTTYFQSQLSKVTEFNVNDYDKYMFFSINSNNSGSGHCPYAGVARRPGSISHIAHRALVTGVHEFGHNLGLQHASKDINKNGKIDSTVAEVYGDWSTPMGNDFTFVPHFNPPNAIELGLFDGEPGSILSVDSSGIYQVDALAGDANGNHPKILKIEGSLSQYKVSIAYRGNIDMDNGINTDYRNKVAVYDGVTRANGSNFGSTGSAFLGALNVGASPFTESNSNLQVKFLSLDGQTAEVEITFPSGGGNNANCFKRSPTIKLKGYQQIDEDSFDLQLSVLNNNSDCDPMMLSLGLDSYHFNIPSQPADLSLANGEEKNISVSVDLNSGIDLNTLTRLFGKITLTDAGNTYVKNFEFSHDQLCVP